ncbi:MAG: hypothetical protein H6835_02035 [Planctomycetes bacterium]|nr:hypothetical protein [Planctomycetota bacterium]
MNPPSNERSSLPNRPDASERRLFRHHSTLPDRLPPGPGRRYDRRHFARMASGDGFVLLVLGGFVLFWFGVDLGILPDVFGWHSVR